MCEQEVQVTFQWLQDTVSHHQLGTVASYTNSGAHDLSFGLGLLHWMEQICLQ